MVVPVFAGIVASLVLQFLLAAFGERIAACCLDPRAAAPVWYVLASSPLGALVALTPGFIAGWLSQTKGVAAGFIAGLFGNAIYSATFHTFWGSVVEDGVIGVVEMMVRLLALASWWALIGGAAGGTAQLLRSNKVLQGAVRNARA